MLLAALCVSGPDLCAQPSPGIVPDHVVIKFREDKVKQTLKLVRNVPLARVQALLNLPPGAQLQETEYATWAKSRRNGRDTGAFLAEFMYLKLPPGLAPDKCVERLRYNPLIEYVEVDAIGEGGSTFPTDPDYNAQWALREGQPQDNIRAPAAWDFTTGSSNVIVAVLDTGCNTNLQEFIGRTVPGTNCITAGASIDDDNGHGTMVAGVLCASANNGTNIAGMDWHCRLMPVKVLNSSNAGPYSAWATGIKWATDNGAKVINLSAGGTNTSWDTLSNAVSYAVSNGAVFVTITHNFSLNHLTVPGTHPDAIAVGGTENTGQRRSTSDYGINIALVAPGAGIYTVGTNGVTTSGTGTSFAAPYVAGVASLILSLRPELDNGQVRTLLCAGADDQVSTDPLDTPGCDMYYGWGRLNAYQSLWLAQTEVRRFAVTNGNCASLAWTCPSNSAARQTFLVDYAPSPTGLWTTVTNGIAYALTNAVWVDTNAAAGVRFYRVKVKGAFEPWR